MTEPKPGPPSRRPDSAIGPFRVRCRRADWPESHAAKECWVTGRGAALKLAFKQLSAGYDRVEIFHGPMPATAAFANKHDQNGGPDDEA